MNINSMSASSSTESGTEITALPKPKLHDRDIDMRTELDKVISADAREAQNQPEILGLVGYLKRCWTSARRAKQPVQLELYESSLRRQGRYTDDKIAEIRKQGGSEIFMGLTSVKCRACESWLDDAYGDYESIWNIKPTPIPDLPPNLKQYVEATVQRGIAANQNLLATFQDKEEFKNFLLDETKKNTDKVANETSQNMRTKMQDQMVEADFKEALKECRSDIVTYKAGFLKGPIVRRKKQLTWQQNEESGKWEPVQADTLRVSYERVSPFAMYPSSSSVKINDGFMFEHHRLSQKSLTEMKGVVGYNDSAIDLVLENYTSGSSGDWAFSTGNDLEQKAERPEDDATENADDMIDALEFWGDCQGKLLIEWGMSKEDVPDEYESYQINAWLVGNYVIKAIINPNKEGKRPYYKASFESIPGKYWGRGIPELMRDLQEKCNATSRALINNLSLASGPFIMIDESQMAAGQDYENIHPLKIFYYDSSKGFKGRDGIQFKQPTSNAGELLAVYDSFQLKADEYTGIPAYTYGMGNVGGAGKALANYEKILTSSGMIEIGLIKKGCMVNNSYGSFSEVTGVYPQGDSDIFRMKFNNGEHVDCDAEHRWSVRDHHGRKFRTLTTKEILDKGLFRKTKVGYRNPTGYKPKWMLPIVDCVQFKERKVKVDPYTMGALIGDGDSRCRLTSMDKEIFDRIPYSLGKPDKKEGTKAIARAVKGIKQDYLSYGLKCKSIDKFIPEDYLLNSKEVRLELLRGLMDSDGCCTADGSTFFSSSSYKLITDFKKLVKSLGAVTFSTREEEAGEFEIRGRKCYRQKNYRLTFNLSNEQIFHLTRKIKRTKVKPRTHTYITGIEYIGRYPATCITVDSKDKLFVCENFIPTHNTASGLSMLMQAASKSIKFALSNIDTYIVLPAVESLYIFNMQYSDDESIKGDLKVIAKGALSLVAKEQLQIRRTEFLNMIGSNQMYSDILGKRRIAYLLRDAVRTLEMPIDDIIPSDRELESMEIAEQKLKELIARQQAMGQPDGAVSNSGAMVPNRGTPPNPQALDMAGNPAQGKDAALFMSKPQSRG